MALTDMKVFNEYLYLAVTEVVDQQVQLFNSASAGTIMLSTKRNVGDFAMKASFAAIPGLMRRRDSYGTGDVAAVALTMLQNNSVKVAGGTVPVKWEPQQFSWIQQNPELAAAVIGEQVAKGLLQDQLNSALAALRGAVVNVGATVNYQVLTSSIADATLSLNALNSGAAKFGDRSQEIRAWAMHSKPLHDLYDKALTNSNQLFVFGDVQVREDGFGRRFIVSDSPSLSVTSGSPAVTDYYTLGLVPNAVAVEDNDDFFSNVDTRNGTENIARTWQAEFTFNLSLKGYTWDTAAGGKSPTNTEIATGTNWDKTATSIKDTAGVAVKSR
jgi:hypothetical protein